MDGPRRGGPRMPLLSLALLFAGSAGNSVVSFGCQLLLARHLSLADYGRLSALMVAVNLATPLAIVGIPSFWLQAFGREGIQARRWIRPSLVVFVLSATATSLVVGAYVAMTSVGPGVIRGGLVAGCVTMLVAQALVELVIARLQIEERFGALSVLQGCLPFARLVVVACVAWALQPSLLAVVSGYAGAAAAVAAWSARALVQMRSDRFRPAGRVVRQADEDRPAVARWVLRQAMPFAMITLCFIVGFQSVLILLDRLAGPEQAALYQSALLVIQAAYLLPNIVYHKFLSSKISRWVEHDRPKLIGSFHLGVVGMFGAGIACMLAILVFAHPIVALIYGAKYAGAAPVLSVLALAIPINFVQHVCSSLLVSREHVLVKVRFAWVSAGSCVAANLVLVPWLGALGGALSAVLAESVALALVWHAMPRLMDSVRVGQSFSLTRLNACVQALRG